MRFEFLGLDVAPSKIVSPYISGVYKHGETQMYLRIYSSVDRTLELGSDSVGSDNDAKRPPIAAAIMKPSSAAAVLSWLSESLPTGGSFLGRLMR